MRTVLTAVFLVLVMCLSSPCAQAVPAPTLVAQVPSEGNPPPPAANNGTGDELKDDHVSPGVSGDNSDMSWVVPTLVGLLVVGLIISAIPSRRQTMATNR